MHPGSLRKPDVAQFKAWAVVAEWRAEKKIVFTVGVLGV